MGRISDNGENRKGRIADGQKYKGIAIKVG